MSNEDNKKYVQLRLDKSKKAEKKVADYLDYMQEEKSINNKAVLLMALTDAIEKKDKVANEIKDLKAVIENLTRALVNGEVITYVNTLSKVDIKEEVEVDEDAKMVEDAVNIDLLNDDNLA